MTHERPAPIHDDGWLITPRALTSVATIVGLVYTLHAPVRYILQVGATVDALTARVATLEAEVDQQRGTIAAATLAVIASETERAAVSSPGADRKHAATAPQRPPAGAPRQR